MKAHITTRKAFLDDIEVGDVVSNKSRYFAVTRVTVTAGGEVRLFDGDIPALTGKKTTIVTVAIRKEKETKTNDERTDGTGEAGDHRGKARVVEGVQRRRGNDQRGRGRDPRVVPLRDPRQLHPAGSAAEPGADAL